MQYSITASRAWSVSGVAIKAAGTPVISATGTLSAVNTTFGSASGTPTSFSVSGTDMTAGITVTPPAGFEVSTTSGSGYASSIVVGFSSTIAATTVFVRLSAATVVGTYSGNITLSSTGATSQTIATASSVVSKATPTVTTVPTASSITFGQTLASSSLTGGVASTGGSFAFTLPGTTPNAGTASQGITFTPTDSLNYNTATGSVSVTVAKATPTITTVPTALSISYGNTLANSTLSGGVASVPGSFAFTDPNIAPNAGTALQEITFTPTDLANYNPVTASINVEVAKATPTITTVPNASPIIFGDTLASSSLTGGVASTGGSFAFTTPGTAPNAGTDLQEVTFTPTDTANFETTTDSVDVEVAKALATVTLGNLIATEDDTAKSVTATPSPAGLLVSVTYDGSSTAPTLAGSYPVVATISDLNFEGSATGTLVILPKPPVFAGYAVSTKMDKVLPIFPVKILVRASDPNGGTVALPRVFATSLHGELHSSSLLCRRGLL